jgi:molecular chaperone IbpA
MRTGTLTLNNYLDDMLRDLNRFAVGYEPTMRVLDNLRHNSNQGFPPYDLEKISDTEYRLSMAVAGYSADNLDIMEHDGVLTITGKVSEDEARTYLHKGIAGRSFKRSFYLDQYVRVLNSHLANGVLTLSFVKEVPEALKPRKIEIGAGVTKPVIEG